jgi:predicted transcriptional regulator
MGKPVGLRMSDEEHSELVALAKKSGQNVSTFVRNAVFRSIKKERTDREEIAQILAKMSAEIDAIKGVVNGINTTQNELLKVIARAAIRTQFRAGGLLEAAGKSQDEIKDLDAKSLGIIDKFIADLGI